MTQRLYRDDPYRIEFDAAVRERRHHADRVALILDQTAFYPESGGQPWDTGALNGVPVVAVVEEQGEILHVMGGPLAEDRVHGVVDGVRRRDHREQHHGQHLLSRAFVEVAAAQTVSFHLGADVSTIDLDREVTDEQVQAAEVRTNEVVWEARPVTVRTVSRSEAQRLAVEPPEEAGDAIRLVEAAGFDLQPCGGTHPRSTAEVGVVLVLGHERYKSGSRVRFVCGHRALDAFRRRAAALDRVAAIASAPIDELPAAVQGMAERLEAANRRNRDLLGRALDGEAYRLLAATMETPAVIIATYDGWTPDELRSLAIRLTSLGRCVALLGSRADKAHVVFAQSEGLGCDVPKLLAQAVTGLGGKGGGRGNVAQGGGPLVERLADVLAEAAVAARASMASTG
jgi:alanyl-tRNA synthetase